MKTISFLTKVKFNDKEIRVPANWRTFLSRVYYIDESVTTNIWSDLTESQRNHLTKYSPYLEIDFVKLSSKNTFIMIHVETISNKIKFYERAKIYTHFEDFSWPVFDENRSKIVTATSALVKEMVKQI